MPGTHNPKVEGSNPSPATKKTYIYSTPTDFFNLTCHTPAEYDWRVASDRDKMIQALKAVVVPELRAKSFEGTFPHFRRRSGEFLHLLSIQFNKHGRSFVVEVGRCPSDGLDIPLGKRLPASEVTVWRLHPNERIRLGADHTETDHWFRFDQLLEWDRHNKAARGVLPYLDSMAESWWNRPM